ncbi:Serine acetyltransferase, N-terminal [Musa troglodytarum]|uniref:serine O-acetyltransferase n=1 Tax=Musa troglodytarum TaxID=320322 RepID=A0A9E7G6C9_9LILI|nr:Serine acetyltransferase, N-terminal [Musa troglodytarum]
MARRCVVIQDVEEGEELKSKGRVSSRRCRTEMMFPMYAMGSFKPNSIARTILDTAGDPIWDSVRADARFEAFKDRDPACASYSWALLYLKGVTLGGTGKEVGDRHPKIGQGALIGASATVLGNIVIGEGAMIAAGSLVLKDDEDPSLTMKHDAGKDYFEHVAASSSDGLNNGIHCSGRKS